MTSSGVRLAGGVDAVGDHDDRPPALAVAGQVVGRLVQRVVQRGGAEGLELVEAASIALRGRCVNGTTPQ